MADIVRLFRNELDGGNLAMDTEGQVFDITNMFVFNGEEFVETDELGEAERAVIKLGEHDWLSLDISDKTPWAGSVN